MYALTIAIRLAWSLSIGIVFFVVGLIFFLIFDILMPNSDKGYKFLNYMYKIGSLGSFKGLKMHLEQDNFAVSVEKKRQES